MRKGIRSFCNGDGSTSTLNQHNSNKPTDRDYEFSSNPTASPNHNFTQNPTPTLEEMILQLKLEEEMARKAKLNEYNEMRGRMSCVNNSDILRSARNALNHYPRFSLDGKDAMYRSSFRNGLDPVANPARKSVCCDGSGFRGRLSIHDNKHFDFKMERSRFCLPRTIAGVSVIWRKPGVVAKLMGLEAIPVPVNNGNDYICKEKLRSIKKRQHLKKRAERHEMERRLAVDYGCCSSNTDGYCVMKPVVVEPTHGSRPIRRHFL